MSVDDTYTKSLLHFDGTDASTTFTDESGRTWTAHGNAQLDTAQKKFGTASLISTGVGDYIETPSEDGVNLADCQNFTIDFWVKRILVNDYAYLVYKQNYSLLFNGNALALNKLDFNLYHTDNSSLALRSSNAYTSTSWMHVAIVKVNTKVSMYVNGILETYGNTTKVVANSTVPLYLGTWNGVLSNGGVWIDEFRITKHFARWQENFTPPTSAYDYIAPSGVYKPRINVF